MSRTIKLIYETLLGLPYSDKAFNDGCSKDFIYLGTFNPLDVEGVIEFLSTDYVKYSRRFNHIRISSESVNQAILSKKFITFQEFKRIFKQNQEFKRLKKSSNLLISDESRAIKSTMVEETCQYGI